MIHLMFEASWSSTEAFELSKWFSLSERPQFFTLPLSFITSTCHIANKNLIILILGFPKMTCTGLGSKMTWAQMH